MTVDARTLALAGVLQAGRLALDLARTGTCEPEPMHASLDSVLAIDAPSAAAVYGGSERLALGLRTLAGMLDGHYRDPPLLRMTVTLLHLERALARSPATLVTLRTGIVAANQLRERFGADHDELAERLGDLYAETLSKLSPRVMVEGTARHLDRPAIVTRIRALLLAAIRSAVLWRQSGGNYWNLFWERHAMAQLARRLATA
jgi:high frequency lysogenization protein